jgi:hypothetical protein
VPEGWLSGSLSRASVRVTRAPPLPSLRLMAAAGRKTEGASASVEHAGLVALVACLLLATVAAVAARPPGDAGRELGSAIARRIACAPRLPDACRHHPLVPGYGWPLARLVRALAPAPVARTGPSQLPLVPVDFRYCRRASCAVPLAGAAGLHLTRSGRRTTAFTAIDDRRRAEGFVEIAYWLYRPTLGWELISRRATQSDVDAAADVRVLERDDPALVPLETLPGRNHYAFPASERPPWQWQVEGRYPGFPR